MGFWTPVAGLATAVAGVVVLCEGGNALVAVPPTSPGGLIVALPVSKPSVRLTWVPLSSLSPSALEAAKCKFEMTVPMAELFEVAKMVKEHADSSEAEPPEKPCPRLAGPRHGAELFAGAGLLTVDLIKAGIPMEPLFEAYSRKGVYIQKFDLDCPGTRLTVLNKIVKGAILYLHIGAPCKSCGPANTRNGETRSDAMPYGNHSLEREMLGNMQAKYIVEILLVAIQHGVHFTIESPHGSFLFKCLAMLSFFDSVCCFTSIFDQCQYGLTLIGANGPGLCRKRTCVIGTFPEIQELSVRCPRDHEHVWAWGAQAGDTGRQVHRAALAGRYPSALTMKWSALVARGLAGPAPRRR